LTHCQGPIESAYITSQANATSPQCVGPIEEGPPFGDEQFLYRREEICDRDNDSLGCETAFTKEKRRVQWTQVTLIFRPSQLNRMCRNVSAGAIHQGSVWWRMPKLPDCAS